jgi:hypothetical protein
MRDLDEYLGYGLGGLGICLVVGSIGAQVAMVLTDRFWQALAMTSGLAAGIVLIVTGFREYSRKG